MIRVGGTVNFRPRHTRAARGGKSLGAPLRTKVNQHRRLFLRQIVQARFGHDAVALTDAECHALRLLVHLPLDRLTLVGVDVVERAADDSLLC